MIRKELFLAVFLGGVFLFNVDLRLNSNLFSEIKKTSDLYLSQEGEILRLTTTEDEQYLIWQDLEDYPEELSKYLLHLEDQQFESHPGVNPYSIIQALFNWGLYGEKLRGASTITMQLARLHYQLYTRDFLGKFNQIVLALYLELSLSKKEILEAYLNLAPMGRNIQGFETASRIYFHRPTSQLAPEELIALVSFPQNPAIVGHHIKSTVPSYHLSRGNRLVDSLKKDKVFSKDKKLHLEQVQLLPIESIPFRAAHFVDELVASRKYEGIIKTTLKLSFQRDLEGLLSSYLNQKKRQGIKNASFAVLNWKNNEVVALSGSADFFNKNIHGQVNGTLSLRSPGSTLKPFAYALGMDQGIIHPELTIHDAPSMYKLPENYDKGYLGPISISKALNLSRNVPAVMLSSQLNHPSFHQFLKMTGEPNLKKQSFYGHTLVLGTKEMSLQRILKFYAALARNGIFKPFKKVDSDKISKEEEIQIFSKDSAVLIKEILAKTPRPNFSGNLYQVNPDNIFWKTGTSWGYRDAWTFGIQGQYVVGVWVGNFTSIESESFVGIKSAAPLMFKLLDGLPKNKRRDLDFWHQYAPRVVEVEVCSMSGMHPSKHCPHKKSGRLIAGISPTKKCQIHRPALISLKTKKRSCLQSSEDKVVKVFEFWPSHIEKLYESIGLFLKGPPEYSKECRLVQGIENQGQGPQIIYPKRNNRFVLSRKENRGKFVLKASAETGVKDLFWYSKNMFLGKSRPNQPLQVSLNAGHHLIRVIDSLGRTESRKVFVDYK